ncbi:MAG: hypothetical protein JWR42_1955 [Marmoricola sp.]|nr:hypothetical protein [Marmoricola sp.]
MGHDERPSVADRYGLARGNRERRWTLIVDVTLAVAAVSWLLVLRSGTAAPGLRWAVSLVLLAMVAHRLLLVSDRRRRRRASPALIAALETLVAPAADPVAAADPGSPAGPHAA